LLTFFADNITYSIINPFYYRKQEEESLKMAIELSKSEASGGAADSSHDNNGVSTGVLGNIIIIV